MASEVGPIYGVPLIDSLPLNGGMRQAMPSRDDLVRVKGLSARTVAGYEVLLNSHQGMLSLLQQLRRWDHLEGSADGPYWKNEIDQVIEKARNQ